MVKGERSALLYFTPLPVLFPITMFEAFLFTFPSPFFATVVVFVPRLITLFQTFLIVVTAMTDAMMLFGLRLRHQAGVT
jgi:hypothetical protein